MNFSSNAILRVTQNGLKAIEHTPMPVKDRFFLSEMKRPILVKDLYVKSRRESLEFQKTLEKFYLSGWIKTFDSMEQAEDPPTSNSLPSEPITSTTGNKNETQALDSHQLDFANDLNDILAQIQLKQKELEEINQEQQEIETEIEKTKLTHNTVLTENKFNKIFVEPSKENKADGSLEELDFLDEIDFENPYGKSQEASLGTHPETEKELPPENIQKDLKNVADEKEGVGKVVGAEGSQETNRSNRKTNPVTKNNSSVSKPLTSIPTEGLDAKKQAKQAQEMALKKQLDILKKMQQQAEDQKRKRQDLLDKKKKIEDDKKALEEKKKQDLLNRQKEMEKKRLNTVEGLAAYLRKNNEKK